MNLRPAGGIALLVFGLSLALPALQFSSSSSPSSGWETVVFSGTVSIGALMEPSNLKGMLTGGVAVSDQLAVNACLCGTGANLSLLFAVLCGFRRRPTATLLAASAALAAGGMCFLILQSDRSFHPLIGIWLWIGSMLLLSSAAAREVWQTEFGGARFDAALSR